MSILSFLVPLNEGIIPINGIKLENNRNILICNSHLNSVKMIQKTALTTYFSFTVQFSVAYRCIRVNSIA